MFRESFKMSCQNIIYNKMRSFLTTLGIIIGVTAIIALITIVEGVTKEITDEFNGLGAGKITINTVGTTLKSGLTDKDVEDLSKIEYVSSVSPKIDTTVTIVKDRESTEDISVLGRDNIYFEGEKSLIKKGRAINILDIKDTNYVCVIDENLEKKLFISENAVNNVIKINGISFTIIGVMKEDDSSLSSQMSGFSSNGSIIIPYNLAMKMTEVNSINSLELILSDSNKVDEVVDEAESILKQAFNQNEDAYNIINLDSLLETVTSVTGMMSNMLGGIASIALLVGGIGIMNMMLVSVTERTTEIGLRKALGAEPMRIQLQFIIESVILSLMGGLIGLGLGILISWAVSILLKTTFALSIKAILLGVGFSAGVGIVFGWAPARKASKLNPIDALRSM